MKEELIDFFILYYILLEKEICANQSFSLCIKVSAHQKYFYLYTLNYIRLSEQTINVLTQF